MRVSIAPYRPVAAFLAKLLVIYVAWYVVYDLWLLPDGRLDAWVATNAALLSGGVLNLFGIEAFVDGRVVLLASGGGIEVVDNCTGLATIGLFVGFVLAFPGSGLRRALFLPVGAAVIHFANVVRIAFLAWIHEAHPALFDAVHGWGILPFFYAIVFVLWMAWAHYGAERTAPRSRPVAYSVAG